MAAKDAGKTDKQWHANLMCKLSDMLRDEELRTLKQLINITEEVPQKEIEKCNDFYTFWGLLERLGKIRVGEYRILLNYLELLHRQDCVLVIEEHITKIEEYRQGQSCQPGRSRQTDEPFEPRYRQMVEEKVHSKFKELHKNQNPVRAPQESTRVVRAPASADVNIQDIQGWTVLMNVCKFGMKKLASDLIENGADVNLMNKHGSTALMHACTKGYKEIVAALIENGADVNFKNKDGMTALLYANRFGHTEVVAALIENGADVNVTDELGWTALMFACEGGHKEMVAALIENGADFNIKNKNGRTALDYALEDRCDEVGKMLLVAGSKR